MATPEELVIAVCDDNPRVLGQVEELVHRQLKDIPHRLAAFDNSRELLDFARRQPLRLAVLDIRLAEENGIRLAQRLLALQPACRVIFLTAYVAYCQDVYDVDHIAFVLKDEMETRLPVAMTRALAPTDSSAARPAAHPLLTLGKPGGGGADPPGEYLLPGTECARYLGPDDGRRSRHTGKAGKTAAAAGPG